MKDYSNIITLDELLDKEYGVKGTAKREKFQQQCEAFKLGVLMGEARKELGLTKEELAERCGTSKAIITRIENDAGAVKLGTVIKVINELGGKISLDVDYGAIRE